jgi:hypothetical protein
MSPALIQLFAFMSCTFVLGLFVGWALWRYGGITQAAIKDLEEKADYWKKSLDQSRIELWKLQDGEEETKPVRRQSRPASRRRMSESTSVQD